MLVQRFAKPALATSDYHSLAELAVQSADGNHIVEVGWNVDRVVNGDDDPLGSRAAGEPSVGLEPTTLGLKVRCSTN